MSGKRRFSGVWLAGVILALGGCAHAVDEGAIPGATAANRLAYDQCIAAINGGQIKRPSEATGCFIAADRAMASSIKLQKMEIFTAYAGRVQLLGVQADEGKITPQQFVDRLTQARADFGNDVADAYRIDAAKRAQQAAALANFGAAMSRVSADMARQQALTNAQFNQDRTVNCSSVKMGNSIETSCR